MRASAGELAEQPPLTENPSEHGVPSPPALAAAGASVDPYRDWLGVTSLERPPSPYQLLGLAELETSQRAIADAARRVKRTARAYQIGQYRQHALALMTEIGQAADVLSNKEKKAAYDQRRLTSLLTLAEENFPQADLNRPLDEVFAEWLIRCEQAAMPVTRLLPELMQWCLNRSFAWPTRGSIEAPLPVGLWIYAEAAIVGQCVARGSLERRVQAVKQTQQLFGVSSDLSRIINLDIARRPASFAEMDLVRMAAAEPRTLMQTWVDRLAIGKKRIIIEPGTPAYTALAFLLGLVDDNGTPVDEPVRPQTVTPDTPSTAGRLLASIGDACNRVASQIGRWATTHPQAVRALILALAISGGIILLLLALLALVP
jgi:hypothetical protein